MVSIAVIRDRKMVSWGGGRLIDRDFAGAVATVSVFIEIQPCKDLIMWFCATLSLFPQLREP